MGGQSKKDMGTLGIDIDDEMIATDKNRWTEVVVATKGQHGLS